MLMNEPTIVALNPLSHDEERERLHLERKVERAFYEAGVALQTLRDKKLYRSTHSNFRDYCQQRFGFGKSAVYYLIGAVDIVDNLKKCPLLVDTLPTSETQCRPLKSLKTSELQQQAWQVAVEKAQGIPSAKIVREVVNQIKGKKTTTKNNPQTTPKIEYIPIVNPKIGQQVRICRDHPLFPELSGTITQLPNRSSAVVDLENQQRELIHLKDLEMRCDPAEVSSAWESAPRQQRIVDSNGKVTSPYEGINHVRGVGLEWYVRLDEETWHKLNNYAQRMGTATLGSAIARLLEAEL